MKLLRDENILRSVRNDKTSVRQNMADNLSSLPIRISVLSVNWSGSKLQLIIKILFLIGKFTILFLFRKF